MDVLFASMAGVVFSLLIGVMIHNLAYNAHKGITNNREYFLPCFSMILTFPSMLLLIDRIRIYSKYVSYLVAGTIFCIIMFLAIYVMLYYFDRVFLKRQSPERKNYNATKWPYIFVASAVSSVSISVLLGWFLSICLLFPE
jgi:hypothetical protein